MFKEFENAPEAGEGSNAKDGGNDNIVHQAGGNGKGDADKQEHPPTTYAEVILRLDDDGVEKAYNKECGKAYEQSADIHNIFFI